MSKFKLAVIILPLAVFLLVWNIFFKIHFNPDEKLPDFFAAQIAEDTNKPIPDLNPAWEECQSALYARYKVYQHKLYVNASNETQGHPRFLIVSRALQQVARFLPDVDFICNFADAYSGDIPCLTFAKPSTAKAPILLPDCEALNFFDRRYLNRSIKKAEAKQSWSTKEETLFWRGGTTGPHPAALTPEEIALAPRFLLTYLGLSNPSINAKFATYAQIDSCFPAEELNRLFPLGDKKTPAASVKYKYLIDIDGNSCCYSRTFWILLSNSLMLKQTTENTQWFYKGLKPYVHYIPIEEHLENLIDQLSWASEHQEACEKIAQQATRFAQENLLFKHSLNYLYHLLQSYAKEQTTPVRLEAGDTKLRLNRRQLFIFDCKRVLKKLTPRPIAMSLKTLPQ